MSESILEWCKAVISTTPARWRNLVQTVPEELLARRPAPEEWSALDCLQHLVETERGSFPTRLKALMAGTSFPGFTPSSNAPAESGAELVAQFEMLRKENLTELDKVTEADLDRQALHGEYGMVTMRQFLHHRAAHDLMHTVQAERAVMQPFINGCGPWQEVYSDHIAKVSG